jgi:hypothetical protein
MANKRITVRLKGTESDNEDLRLSDFITQLDAIRGALSHIEDNLSNKESQPIQYKVVDLKHSSPATIVIEAIPPHKGLDVSMLVVDRFVNGIKSIQGGNIPPEFDYDLLQKLKAIGAPPRKRSFEVTITSDSESIDLEHSLQPDIDNLLGPAEISYGSISGSLEAINLHASANIFRVYPTIGPKKIDCFFKTEQLSKAISGINHYVHIYGELVYKQRERFPYIIRAFDIEVYPDEDSLPSIMDLRGIAPEATGELKSEEFVRRIRNANW